VVELTAGTRRQEMVMLALRKRDGLDLEKFMAATGNEFPRRDPAVERLCSSGWRASVLVAFN
jgi:coproporphyrinogen III oxidase-like Fe-S oxidoreductase